MDVELIQTWQLVLLGVGLTALAVVTWRNPLKAAQATVFLLPAYVLRVRDTLWVPTNVLELLIVVFVSTALLRVMSGKDRLLTLPRRVGTPLLFILAGSIFSTLTAYGALGGDSEAVRALFGALKGFVLVPVVFVALLTALQSTRDRLGELMGIYAWSALAIALFVLIQGFLKDIFPAATTFDGRLRGFYLSPNHLAMYLLPAAVVLFTRLGAALRLPVEKQERYRLLVQHGAPFGLLLLVLGLTESSGAIVGFVVAVIVFTQLVRVKDDGLRQETAKKFLFVLALGALLVGLLTPIIGGGFADTVWEQEVRSPLASRLMIWRAATELVVENPIAGIGPGLFEQRYLGLQEEFPPFLEWAVPHPHNLLFAVWLSTGLLGLAGFIWLLLSALTYYSNKTIATSLVLVAILVHGIVDAPFIKNDLSVLLLLFCAASLFSKRKNAAE